MREVNHITGRVFSILHTVSSLGVGGMERVILQLASAQQEAGHRVAVMAIRGGSLEREAKDRGLRVHVLNGGRIGRSLQALRCYFKSQPDIVHVHNPTSLHYAVLSKLVSRATVVITIHSERGTHARPGSALEWWLTRSVVVVSRAAAETLHVPFSRGPLTVIHNGITLASRGDSRDQVRRDLGWQHEFVGIIVARIDGRKGHQTLVTSVRTLTDLNVGVRVLVVGDGKDRASVEHLAQELGLAPGIVRLLGNRSDIDALLDASDFFVLPSDVEGLPLSVLEAMAHGLPIVASNVGGIPEIIEHEKEGLLVPSGDPSALANAIRRLAFDGELRRALGDAARERANRQFSMASTLQSYQRVYESAVI
jgi:L-malate glycosyltransferase